MKTSQPRVDAVVIGAGFGGMYALYALRQHGLSTRCFEAADNVGGTWYWNRYPGARCDVESLDYQYLFSEDLINEWTWSERYATQPEILEYAIWACDRLDLRKHITFETRVVGATFDGESSTWTVETNTGEKIQCRYLVAASGALSAVTFPDITGLDSFTGEIYHTGAWPHETVNFEGLHVGIIGVGSSGVQLIPEIAKQAEHVTVFQRTPAYTIPARNRELNLDEIQNFRQNFHEIKAYSRSERVGISTKTLRLKLLEVPVEQREIMLELNWKLGGNLFMTAFSDTSSNLEANKILSDFVRKKIRTIVENPKVAEKLTPRSYPIGSKRIITDTNYWATFNRENVTLVDVTEEPISAISSHTVETEKQNYDCDALVFATGYDGVTGSLKRMNINGPEGVSLSESWEDGVHTYLGIMTHGFPNLFLITGPQSPSVLANMFASIEQHVEWMMDCIKYMEEHGHVEIEPLQESEDWWKQQVTDAVEKTLFLHAKSWYVGANIPGKNNEFLVYPGGFDNYKKICQKIVDQNYQGFVFDNQVNHDVGAGSAVPLAHVNSSSK